MRGKFMKMYLFPIIFFLLSCSGNANQAMAGNGQHPLSKPEVEAFVVDNTVHYQSIDNFGASDAWSMQYVGLWPEEKQNQIAEWLFSTETDEAGNPRGIGLSLWRFYIGAGSKQQGADSKIDNIWRRSECFLLPDGSYNWDKQQGQRNFARLAQQYGVNQFLGFILTPPVYYTQNGLATNLGRGANFNIQPDKYDDYVRFLADVVEEMDQYHEIHFNYLCPFNEPDGHWNWDGTGQEGTAATKYEVAQTVRLLGQEFARRNIDTKILTPESFDYNCMYRTHPLTRPDRGYQIQSYFTPDSMDTYIGDVPNVPRLMAAHSYWTNTPVSNLRIIRKEMGDVLKLNNVRYWQTEVCIMSNDDEIGGGGGKDLGMKTALYVARVIHHDLVYANASAWQWWLAVTTGDYKDGLIYTQPDKSFLDGTYTDSKLMWTLGNYSRFIRPGAVRIGVKGITKKGKVVEEGDTDPYGLMVSAYQNTDGTPVVVVINYKDEARTFRLNYKQKIDGWKPFLTSDAPDCKLKLQPLVKNGVEMQIPARSIVTYVGIEK